MAIGSGCRCGGGILVVVRCMCRCDGTTIDDTGIDIIHGTLYICICMYIYRIVIMVSTRCRVQWCNIEVLVCSRSFSSLESMVEWFLGGRSLDRSTGFRNAGVLPVRTIYSRPVGTRRYIIYHILSFSDIVYSLYWNNNYYHIPDRERKMMKIKCRVDSVPESGPRVTFEPVLTYKRLPTNIPYTKRSHRSISRCYYSIRER